MRRTALLAVGLLLAVGGPAGAGTSGAAFKLTVPKPGSVTLAVATIKAPKKPTLKVTNAGSLPARIGIFLSLAKKGKTWTARFVVTNKAAKAVAGAREDFGFAAVNATVPGVSNNGVTGSLGPSQANVGYLDTTVTDKTLCTPPPNPDVIEIVGDSVGSYPPEDVFSLATADACRQPEKGIGNFFAALDGSWKGTTAANATDVATGDFTNDGIQDIAAAGPSGIVLLVGLNDGTFGLPLALHTASPPISISSSDVDLDGITDLAVTEANRVEVFPGGFLFGAAPRTIATEQSNILGVAFGRFNGDALADVAVATANGIDVVDGTATGAFTLGQHLLLPSGDRPVDLAAGDFNADGRPDLLFLGTDGRGDFAISESANVNGTLSPPVDKAFTGADPSIFTPGRQNMIFCPAPPLIGFVASGGARIFSFVPSGALGSEVIYPVGEGASAGLAGDVNGDGLADVLVLNRGAGTVSSFLGAATVAPTAPAPRTSLVGANPVSLSLFNFNGDGKPDLAVANAGSGSGTGNVTVLTGSGTGAFAGP